MALLAVLVACLIAYWPGLAGDFLFDDFANLPALAQHGGVSDLENLELYLASGIAGPTGRPLSLLSFLIDDFTWPSTAQSFKYTNLLIHLLTGCVLVWVTLKLLRLSSSHRTEQQREWIAIMSGAIWLLHPFFVSTTLYVVQRMTQLSALFVLLGLLGYLQGRSVLPHHPRRAYLWMTLSLVGATALATLSKENGILLPLLVLVMEYTVLRGQTGSSPSRTWCTVFVWLPTLAVLGYLVRSVWIAGIAYRDRSFDLGDRLLTEGRVLVDYLYHLFIPRAQTRGLFQDSFPVSSDWWTPPFTLPAWLLICALIFFAIRLRPRLPLTSLAILFFLAAHILESSVLPLEIYFEHRNYLPAAFLFLPLAELTVDVNFRRPPVALAVGTCLLVSLSLLTWQHARLWGNTTQLLLVWAETNRYSERAQGFAAEEFVRQGRPDLADKRLTEAINNMPDRATLHLHRLMLLTSTGELGQGDRDQALSAITNLPCDPRVPVAAQALVNRYIAARTPAADGDYLQRLLQAVRGRPCYGDQTSTRRLLDHTEGLLLTHEGRPQQALDAFSRALAEYNDVVVGLRQAAVLASHGNYAAALDHLTQSEQILANQPAGGLTRSRAFYVQEIARLRKTLDAEQAKGTGR